MFSDFGDTSGGSANKHTDLRPGVYTENLQFYADQAVEVEVFIRLFRLDDETDACLVDVLRIDCGKGEMHMLDFMELPDGSWRRSDGAIAPSFADLLPEEIKALRLMKEYGRGDVIEVLAQGAAKK